MFGVILAGGSGSRLWPLSRELYPKQLLNLYAEKSLLQSTFERLNKFIPSANIISVTNSKHHANVKMQLGEFNGNSIVLPEPVSKNTAPAIALSVKYIIENSDDDETILVVPSDLLIEDNPNNINELKDFVPVICYDTGYNKECVGDKITRCYSWYDIYRKIKDI